MTNFQYKGVMGKPDYVFAVWADGIIVDGGRWHRMSAVDLKNWNDEDRLVGNYFCVIPYRIRVYMHPNKPNRKKS